MGKADGRFVILLDVDRVLAVEEIAATVALDDSSDLRPST